MESKQTAQEALALAIEANRAMYVRGENWSKQANRIIARNVLDLELGKYADHLPIYHLDQETRDRLLVRARQDAAEALCHASTLMDEVHRLKSALRGLNLTIGVMLAAYLLWAWSKSGFAIWDWLQFHP
jgi:hypothetical protein